MSVLDLGFPLWLLVAVLAVFAGVIYYILGGRVSTGLRVPLAIVLDLGDFDLGDRGPPFS